MGIRFASLKKKYVLILFCYLFLAINARIKRPNLIGYASDREQGDGLRNGIERRIVSMEIYGVVLL